MSILQYEETEEEQQVIGNPPSWLLRWGITIILLFIVVVLLLSWIIRYPDTFEARIVLTTEQPPTSVYTQSKGKIEELFIVDYQVVEKGDLLAVIENTAQWKDVFLIEQLIDTLQLESTTILNKELYQDLKVGTLQSYVTDFLQGYENYRYFLQKNIYDQQIASTNERIKDTKTLNIALEHQAELLKKEVEIAHKDFKRNESLYKDRAISALSLEKVETNYLQYQRQLEAVRIQLIQNDLIINQLNTQKLELQKAQSDEQREVLSSLDEYTNQLKAQIELWKQLYVMVAPIDGTISLLEKKPEQFVDISTKLLTIVPEEADSIIGKAVISGMGLGKIKHGMRSIIQLDDYPYQEHGTVEALVKQISLVPQEDGYLVEFSLPNNLSTNYNLELPFRQEMRGDVKIVAKNRRLIERFFDRILSIIA